MPLGPGKYDDLCTYVRERTGGTVLLIVLAGEDGGGFSAQTEDPGMLLKLSEILEEVAAQIRNDQGERTVQ